MGTLKYLLFIAILVISCKEDPRPNQLPTEKPSLKEELIKRNQQRIQTEEDRIEAYIQRRQWTMNESGSGLRYLILKQGDGIQAEKGMEAELSYRISLLNGKECYKSAEGETDKFLIGSDAVESGLHEGVLYLKEGAEAVLIMPPHLAHGLLGDRDKIPANASLVFELKLHGLR